MEKWLNAIEDGFTRLLYVNPPRTGLEDGIAEWITLFMKPVRMAYLSCSAGTLSRDLAILCKSEYYVDKIIPFDFFPQTIHVESLVLLKRG
jgi:tRNA/tmRNA/rRNA uracil-C5-methylase (TrmA/RlmC/RlmD family)